MWIMWIPFFFLYILTVWAWKNGWWLDTEKVGVWNAGCEAQRTEDNAWRTRQELIPLVLHHVRTGSTILTDEWWAYQQALPEFRYKHYTVNHSVEYVSADTGCHTQHIERAWRSYKETIGRLRGNRTKDRLRNHLIMIEWNEWLGKKHFNAPLGCLLNDIAKQYK